jgi:hypothetical protein
MMSRCILCDARGERRPGRTRPGWQFPLCAECFAHSTWNGRQPAPPLVVTFPPTPAEAAAHSARIGDWSLGAFFAARGSNELDA